MKNLRRMPIAILTALIVLGTATAWSADIKSSAADEQAHATAINAAVSRADNVKKAVAEYRLHHDAFPTSNAENRTAAIRGLCQHCDQEHRGAERRDDRGDLDRRKRRR